MERVKNGDRLQAIDQSHYLSVDEPQGAASGDLDSWQKAIEQGIINYQYA